MIEIIGSKIILDKNHDIREYYTKNGIVRAFCCDENIQSLMYVEEGKKEDLAIDYLRFFDLPITLNKKGKNFLLLGGGTLTYPKYFISKYNGIKMDVIELNGDCILYAKKYFGYEEILNKYDPQNHKVNIKIIDALNYIDKCTEKYDYILIDLFNGRYPIREIYKEDNIIKLNKILNDGYIGAINYIVSLGDEGYKEDIRNIKSICKNIKIISNTEMFNREYKVGNIMILFSNNGINIPNDYEYIDLTNIL